MTNTTAGFRSGRSKALFLGSSVMALTAMLAPSAATAQQVAAVGEETVTVTGYAASLEKATEAKRGATNFTDTIFAEDIGKFPDTNIAESLNRIPGVNISREIDGEGVNVQIRGLGTNFTKITLNGAQVSVASTGATDQSNNNREVDLNMFPTELFTQLTVSKSAEADQIEGGAAGVVNMRSARPFDYKDDGFHITYTFQGSDYDQASNLGERGAIIARDTWGDFGVLFGVAGVHNNVFVKGWEDGNGGWVTLGALSAAQCGAGNTCDSIGGNAATIPATVPAGVTTGGLTPVTQTVDAALLTSLNPGLTTAQISNALVPRLGRSMYERGSRDRYNAVFSMEWRPTDSLHFYFDSVFGRTFNDLDRSDIDWGVRAGAGSQPMIPEGLKLDSNGVVTSGTFADAQLFLEARPYKEKGDFFSINPGASWQINELMHVDFQLNASRSHFFRDSPTFLVVTCPSSGNPAGVPGCTAPVGGAVVNFSNPAGSPYPLITSNFDYNNPANFQWNTGRVNLQDEKRYSFTDGAHLDYSWGGDEIALKAGASYDDVFRNITAIDASNYWQNAICGDNPNVNLPPSNTNPGCRGLNVSGNTATVNGVAAGSVPAYLGYGTGFSAGMPALTYSGSMIPQSALAGYLQPGPTGFITFNYPAAKAASNYYAIDQAAIKAVGNALPGTTGVYPYSTASNTGGNSGTVEEKNYGFYLEGVGKIDFYNHDLRYNVGLRWVETHQYITSPLAHVNPLNATGGTGGTALLDGGLYPTTYTFATAAHDYGAFLPSVDLAYNVSDDVVLRFAASRTMTRPNPNLMISGVNFSDLSAQNVNLGNPQLKPFFSNNIDLGVEYYTGGAGYVGVTAFRKSLSGFPASTNVAEPFGYLAQFGITYAGLNATQQAALNGRGCTSDASCSATVTVVEQVNQPGLEIINGLEFDYVQPLDFLLAEYGLEGFGFNGNLTILDQRSTGIAPSFAAGVAPMSYNVTGYYDHGGLSVRLSYVFTDKSYGTGTSNNQNVCLPSTAAAPYCPGGAYLFTAPYGQVDMSSSLALSKLFGDLPTDPELTFDIQNIFKSKLRSYDEFTSATHFYYNQGSVFLFGIRGTW